MDTDLLAAAGGVELAGTWPAALSSRLAVEECAVASVAACLDAAADLAAARGMRRPEISLDRARSGIRAFAS